MTEGTQVSAASSQPDSADESVNDIIAAVTQDAVAETVRETGDVPRDEKGRFTPREATEESAQPTTEAAQDSEQATETTDTPTTDESSAAVTLPEGYVAPKMLDREPLAPFKLLDKDGELAVPDLDIEFNANGKTRREPLDKVVKLAQWGVYNQEREQAVTQAQQESRQVAQAYEQAQQQIARLTQLYERVVTDDQALLQARAEYEQQNTPEAIRQRYEAEIQTMRQQQQFAAVAQQGQQFFEGNVTPAIDAIKTNLPRLAAQELEARLIVDLPRFQDRHGIIPPAMYEAYKQYILQDIVPWAQHIHNERQSEYDRQMSGARAEAEKSKQESTKKTVELQKVKNATARPMRPTNTAQPKATTPAKPVKREYANVDDAMGSALAETLAAVGLGG